MKNRFFKKVQRSINREIHKLNRMIEKDPLFKGRFIMRQFANYTKKYVDGSGYSYYVCIEVIDKKTKKIKKYEPILVLYGWNDDGINTFTAKRFFECMNDFIVEESGFWEEKRNDNR